MPKVSVIIPNYNYGRFLKQRIQSVLDQTYQDFEIIFLDDASGDHSLEVFQTFSGHEKIKQVLLNKKNSGSVFAMWKAGIQAACGDYLWIAEADDYAAPHLLEKLVSALESHTDAGLAYCQSWVTDEQDRTPSSNISWTDDLDPEKWKNDYTENGREECAKHLIIKNTIPNASAVLFKRSVYEKIHGLDENIATMTLSGDWFFWVKILQVSNIAYVAECLNYFRYHPETRRSKTETRICVLEALEIISFIKSGGFVPEERIEKTTRFWAERWFNGLFGETADFAKDRLIYKTLTKLNPRLPFRFFIIDRVIRSRLRRLTAFFKQGLKKMIKR